jgi:hypothetical protein
MVPDFLIEKNAKYLLEAGGKTKLADEKNSQKGN